MKKLLLMLIFFCTSLLSKQATISKLNIPHQKYQLKNGLDVILAKDKSLPFVNINLWYKVGSVDERMGKTGLAHLFEHLMFEGSRHFKNSMHFKLLEGVGAFGINATTSYNRTNYYQTVPKNAQELVLALESSRMSFLDITQEKLDEQRAVVRREREQRLEATPYGLATLKLWQSIFAYDNPLYGRVIGSHEDLKNATLADVKNFYNTHYGPSNASLAIVGDLDEDTAKKFVDKYFASLPRTNSTTTPILPDIKIEKEEVIVVEEKLGKLPLVRMQYITPAIFAPGDAELDVLSYILTSSSGRLTKALTIDNKLAISVSSYQQSLEQLSVFTIDTVLSTGADEKEVMTMIDNVLSDLIKNPPLKTEIKRATNTILTSQLFSLEKLHNRAELLQGYNRYKGDSNYLAKDVDRYLSLTQSDLVNAAKTYIPAKKNRKVLIAKPSSKTTEE